MDLEACISLCLDGLSCANLCIGIQFIKCLTQISYLTQRIFDSDHKGLTAVGTDLPP